jgi:hypothetical protein
VFNFAKPFLFANMSFSRKISVLEGESRFPDQLDFCVFARAKCGQACLISSHATSGAFGPIRPYLISLRLLVVWVFLCRPARITETNDIVKIQNH